MQFASAFLLLGALNAVNAGKCSKKPTISTTTVSSASTSQVPSSVSPPPASSSSSSKISSSTTTSSSSSSSAAPAPTINPVIPSNPPSSLVVNLLDCKPLSIVDQNDYKYSLECRLGIQPNSTTPVFVSGSGLKFDGCSFNFTTSNWNTYQKLNVFTIPNTAGDNTVKNLNLSARSFGTGQYDKKNFQIPYSRQSRKPATCGFSGDPHFVPFAHGGASPYTYMGLGPFYVIDSPLGLRVISNYYRCGNKASCTGGISIQYHDAHYLVSVETKTPSTSLKITTLTNSTLGTTFSTAANGNSVSIALEDGSTITVSKGWSGSLSFSATLSAIYYKKVGGHCNVYDDAAPAKTLYARNQTAYNSTIAAQINTFGNSWAASNSENCFLGTCSKPSGIKTLSSIIPATCSIPSSANPIARSSVPSPPPTYKPCDYVYVNCTNSTLVKRDTIQVALPEDKPCDLSREDAEDICIQAIDTVSCGKLVDVNPFLHACVLDSLTVCGYSFVADHKNAYAATCKAQSDLMLLNNDESIVQQGEAIQARNGFNSFSCPSQCSGHGDCIETGCSCHPGFSGAACDVDLSEFVASNTNAIVYANGELVQ